MQFNYQPTSFNYKATSPDYLGQYRKGVSFKRELEAAKEAKADRAKIKELEEAARREAGMVKDAREVKFRLENNDFKGAQDLAINRLQSLTDEGRDTTQTEGVVGKLVSGDNVGALTDVNAYLASVKQLDSSGKPQVGRFKVNTSGGASRLIDTATGNVVKEWAIPETKLEKQKLRNEIAKTKAAEEKAAKVKAKEETGKQQKISGLERILESTKGLKAHPGLKSASGWQSAFPTIPGSESANFESRLESLKSQQFLAGVEKMRGLGALTGPEGERLISEIASLDINQSDKQMQESLSLIEQNVESALKRLRGEGDEKDDEKGEDKNDFSGFSVRQVN